MSFAENNMRPVIYWLYAIACLIIMMVIVGGLTRLTGSGLSITEWKPISGAIPPLSYDDWLKEFEAYKKIPQYIQLNFNMSLDEFKVIFWWEWGHRQLGRLLGLVFIIPLTIFWIQGRIPQHYKTIMIGLLLGGAFQGFLGWFMVSSGLTERTAVSQYRLALHLGFALLLYIFVLQTAFCLKKQEKFHFSLPKPLLFMVFFVFLQILTGAFMAGTHAGFTYNTWPLLDGAIIPSDLFENGIISMFEDHLTVQFIHRMGAYGVFLYGLWSLYAYAKKTNYGYNIYYGFSLLLPVIVGILTLVTVAPVQHIELAAFHQLTAVFLLTSVLIYGNFLEKH